VIDVRIRVVRVEGYKWLTSNPRQLCECPSKYILVLVRDESGSRVYMLPESIIDP